MIPFALLRDLRSGVRPRKAWSRLTCSALLLGCAGLGLQGQELTLLGGATQTSDGKHSSYNFQFDYLQDIYRNLAASADYINEGHMPGHHRDGTAVELWGRLPFAGNHLAVAIGAGAYFYYDTQFAPAGGSQDVHGTAPIYSVSGTAYLSDRWFARALANRINPAGEMKTNSVSLGLGYWFGQGSRPTPGRLGDAPGEKGAVTPGEFTVYGGKSVVNAFFSPHGQAYSAEYRHGVLPHLDWTASYLFENNPLIFRRNGLATQAWAVNAFFDDTFSVGIGFGAYWFIDDRHPAGTTAAPPPRLAGLGSITLAQRLSRHWLMRLTSNRVGSNITRDADIFLLGLGYRWGS